jgi:hypothetical protein
MCLRVVRSESESHSEPTGGRWRDLKVFFRLDGCPSDPRDLATLWHRGLVCN